MANPSQQKNKVPEPGSGIWPKGPVSFMAQNGVAANILMLAILFAGLFAYRTIPQEVFAETSLDAVSVSVVYPGATPSEIEQSVVQKIEEAVASVEGVAEITATATEGLGSVTVEMNDGVSMSRALDDIKAEVDQIQTFPADAEEPNVRELTTRASVLRVALFGDAPERSLKELAYRLEDELSVLPDVSFVQTSVVRDYEITINVPQEKLEALGLSLSDVSRAVTADSLDLPAGSIDTRRESVRIRTLGQNYDQFDFENIVLTARPDGTIIRLRDIATIDDGFEDSDLIARFNGQPVAFIDVFRTSDDRVLDVAQAVKTYLETDFRPSLPDQIDFAVWNDESLLLEDRLGLLIDNAIIGLILVLIALTLFLDIRLAFWTAVGIGVVFIGAIAVLDLFGSSINMFSLFGFILALGLVVDDAVVVGENIYAEREGGRSGTGAAIYGTRRVVIPVCFAVATTVAAFSPLLAVGGVIGDVLADIPVVVVAVLLLSVIECLYVLPNHLSHLPDPSVPTKNVVTRQFERIQRWVDARFKAFINGPLDRVLRYTVRQPLIVLSGLLTTLIFVFAMLPAGWIKFSFFPEIEGDSVIAQLELPDGAPIDRTEAITARIEAAAEEARRIAQERNGGADIVKAKYSTVGLQSVDGGPDGRQETFRQNLAGIEYSLISSDDRSVSSGQFEQLWLDALGPVPEAKSLSISSSLLSFGAPVAVEMSHPNVETLRQAADDLMAELGRISGVYSLENDLDGGLQEIELTLKPLATTLGLTQQALAQEVRAAFFGSEAVRVQRGREDVRVYVRLPDAERNSIADVERFKVQLPGGGRVPVSDLADVSFAKAATTINRKDSRRVVTITGEVDSAQASSQEVARLLRTETLPALEARYPQLSTKFGGEQEEQQESFGSLGAAFAAALLVIYALLAIPFKSYTQPLIVMAAIPFGMIGAFLGHLIVGIPIGILSMFGIIALSGVIVNGSLVLIDFYNGYVEDGEEELEAIVHAAKSRFRPILLTAITTFLGVAPITFETSLQAQFLIPMSASLGFGVLFGTILLQLLIPALVAIGVKGKRRLMGRKDNEPELAPAE